MCRFPPDIWNKRKNVDMVSAMIHTDILIDEPAWQKKRLGLKTLVPEVLAISGRVLPKNPLSPLEVTVILTSDAAIKRLNRLHRGKNKATNVLSFPLWPALADIPAGSVPIPAGDIVIALETMEREAAEQGKLLRDHFAHMLVHGFLHLLGYDHLQDDEALAMERLEAKILKKMRIKDPYAA